VLAHALNKQLITRESLSKASLHPVEMDCVLGAELSLDIWVNCGNFRCYLKSIHDIIIRGWQNDGFIILLSSIKLIYSQGFLKLVKNQW
jgi:hypothetical protein